MMLTLVNHSRLVFMFVVYHSVPHGTVELRLSEVLKHVDNTLARKAQTAPLPTVRDQRNGQLRGTNSPISSNLDVCVCVCACVFFGVYRWDNSFVLSNTLFSTSLTHVIMCHDSLGQDFMVIAVAEGAGQKFVSTGKTDA